MRPFTRIILIIGIGIILSMSVGQDTKPTASNSYSWHANYSAIPPLNAWSDLRITDTDIKDGWGVKEIESAPIETGPSVLMWSYAVLILSGLLTMLFLFHQMRYSWPAHHRPVFHRQF